jgi:hypothetical protein
VRAVNSPISRFAPIMYILLSPLFTAIHVRPLKPSSLPLFFREFALATVASIIRCFRVPNDFSCVCVSIQIDLPACTVRIIFTARFALTSVCNCRSRRRTGQPFRVPHPFPLKRVRACATTPPHNVRPNKHAPVIAVRQRTARAAPWTAVACHRLAHVPPTTQRSRA